MGFCLFNNVALAAHHARTAHELTRILIVDWDVHHGNGTQDVFYEDRQVLFFSIHRYGRASTPAPARPTRPGTGKGLGHTLNVPVPLRHAAQGLPGGVHAVPGEGGRQDQAGAGAAQRRLRRPRPRPDRLARPGDGGLRRLTQQVLDVARTHARGRLVSCLEGGYNLDVLAEAVQAHLEELLAAKR